MTQLFNFKIKIFKVERIGKIKFNINFIYCLKQHLHIIRIRNGPFAKFLPVSNFNINASYNQMTKLKRVIPPLK